jgi:hypothetical protein
VLLACCDKSTIVALEAIKGLAGMSTCTLPGLCNTHGWLAELKGLNLSRQPALCWSAVLTWQPALSVLLTHLDAWQRVLLGYCGATASHPLLH